MTDRRPARFRDALRRGLGVDAAFGFAEAAEADRTGQGRPLDDRLIHDYIKEIRARYAGSEDARMTFHGGRDQGAGGIVPRGKVLAGMTATGDDQELDTGSMSADELFRALPNGRMERMLLGDRKRLIRDAIGTPKTPKTPSATPAPTPGAKTPPPPSLSTHLGNVAHKGLETARSTAHGASESTRSGLEKAGEYAHAASNSASYARRMAGDAGVLSLVQAVAKSGRRGARDAAKRQPDGSFRSDKMTPVEDAA